MFSVTLSYFEVEDRYHIVSYLAQTMEEAKNIEDQLWNILNDYVGNVGNIRDYIRASLDSDYNQTEDEVQDAIMSAEWFGTSLEEIMSYVDPDNDWNECYLVDNAPDRVIFATSQINFEYYSIEISTIKNKAVDKKDVIYSVNNWGS